MYIEELFLEKSLDAVNSELTIADNALVLGCIIIAVFLIDFA